MNPFEQQVIDDIVNHVKNVPSIFSSSLNTPDWLMKLSADISWSDVIQEAIEKYHKVYVPYVGHPVLLHRTLVLHSGCTLRVHPKTVIRMMPGCGGCMVRNDHISSSVEAPVKNDFVDEFITIEGGIWEPAEYSGCPNDMHFVIKDLIDRDIMLGTLFFSNARRILVSGATLRKGTSYGVLISNCEEFIIENLCFDEYAKDGVHINGPAAYGIIRNLSGYTGDDMVALNAWDWHTAAVSYGTIHHMLVEDLLGFNNEMRLLPGRKTYGSGEKLDCDLYDCVVRKTKGIYNFKLYAQPYCYNSVEGINDCSEIPGNISNLFFDEINIEKIMGTGLAEVHLDAIFEICADCENLFFENITLNIPMEDLRRMGMSLLAIGPKSYTWKMGSDNPTNWTELFDPDIVCTVRGIHIRNVRLARAVCTNAELLVRTTKLTVNHDYPNTTPRGGTGYGIVTTLEIDG